MSLQSFQSLKSSELQCGVCGLYVCDFIIVRPYWKCVQTPNIQDKIEKQSYEYKFLHKT